VEECLLCASFLASDVCCEIKHTGVPTARKLAQCCRHNVLCVTLASYDLIIAAVWQNLSFRSSYCILPTCLPLLARLHKECAHAYFPVLPNAKILFWDFPNKSIMLGLFGKFPSNNKFYGGTHIKPQETKMSPRIAALLLLAAFAFVAKAADSEPRSSGAKKALGFLEIGRDYLVMFPDSHNVFKSVKGGVEVVKQPDGEARPISWSITQSVKVFTVRGTADDAWVLLEHPSELTDSSSWNLHKLAKAQLTTEHIKQIEAADDGGIQLKAFRSYAARKIKTTTTWVNLDHAIAIADVPKDLDVNALMHLATYPTIPNVVKKP